MGPEGYAVLGLFVLLALWGLAQRIRDRGHKGLACPACERPIRSDQRYVQLRGSLYHTGCKPEKKKAGGGWPG